MEGGRAGGREDLDLDLDLGADLKAHRTPGVVHHDAPDDTESAMQAHMGILVTCAAPSGCHAGAQGAPDHLRGGKGGREGGTVRCNASFLTGVAGPLLDNPLQTDPGSPAAPRWCPAP